MNSGRRKVDLVYTELKSRFLAGDFRFGEQLVVNDLATSMGTSRQPVLDAIKRLQDDGLVEVTPQVGSHVIIPSPHSIEDFFEVFATLEGLVARLAAERHREEQLVELELTAGLILRAKTDRGFDLPTYLAGNRRFHEAIHALAASEEAASAAHRFWDRSDFLIACLEMSDMEATLKRSAAEHKKIVAAIRARDGERAQQLALAHVRGFTRPVEKSLRHAVQDLRSTSGPSGDAASRLLAERRLAG